MENSTPNQDKKKRPVIIVLFCLFVLFVHGGDFIRSFTTDRFLEIMSYVPLWYFLFMVLVLYPAEIFAVIEIWRMKRRGLWIYGVMQVIWTTLWIFYFNAFPKMGQLILLAVYVLIVLMYYKDMEPYPKTKV